MKDSIRLDEKIEIVGDRLLVYNNDESNYIYIAVQTLESIKTEYHKIVDKTLITIESLKAKYHNEVIKSSISIEKFEKISRNQYINIFATLIILTSNSEIELNYTFIYCTKKPTVLKASQAPHLLVLAVVPCASAPDSFPPETAIPVSYV